MRILQVHTRYREPGGEDTVVTAERRLLAAAGHEVVVHEAHNPQGAGSVLAIAASPWNPVAAARATRLAGRVRPDVVHVHNTWYAMGRSVPARLARVGVPVVATLHNYRRVCPNASLFRDGHPCEDCVGRSPWPGVIHRCYRSSAVASAAVAVGIELERRGGLLDRSVASYLVLNAFMRDVLVRGGLPPDKVVVKGNSVPDPGERPASPSASATLLVVGRLAPLKGVDVLLDAWELARPSDLQLLVVGDGPLRATLEARNVPGVRFLGRQTPERVRDLMLAARALALPSVWYEGQPMSVLEAMAAGLAVLASDTGGMDELLTGAGREWLVPRGDVRSWAAALERLAELPADRLDAAGAALRQRWSTHHSESVALAALEDVYAKAVA